MPTNHSGYRRGHNWVLLAIASCGLIAACGGSSGNTNTPTSPNDNPAGQSGGFTLSASGTVSIVAGQSANALVLVTRTSGFGGAVTVSVASAPPGVTAVVSGSPTQSSSVTVAISVASTVTPGTYQLVVKGTASGVAEQSLSLTLVVAAAAPASFSLSVDPVEFEIPAGNGWSAYGIASITRANGFTGPITISVTGLNGASGALVAPSPSTVPATESAVNLMALALDGASPGTYTGTVHATSPGSIEQTATVRVKVAVPGTGDIKWRFCNASRVPRFFAVKDGSGAWRHVVPSGPASASLTSPTTFAFSLTQPTAIVAMVRSGEKTSSSVLIQGFRWDVYYLTRQEIVEQAAAECERWPDATTRSANAQVTGYQLWDALVGSASHHALVNTGNSGAPTTSLSISNIQPGKFDLFVTRSSFAGSPGDPISPRSIILRRDQDPADGAALSTLDFSAEGFVPATGALTFNNTTGESFSVAQVFRTLNGLEGLMSAVAPYEKTSRTWFGVPSARLKPGDLHELVATTANLSARRSIVLFADSVATRTLDFGPSLPQPSVTAGGAQAPWLIRSTGTLPADYDSRASVYLRETIADPRAFMLIASRGYMGATGSYDLSIPDLSSATGFTLFWNARRGSSLKWTVTGGQGDPGSAEETFCIFSGICPVKPLAGAVYKSAQATGMVTIP